jgi:hypothetical protein
LSRTAIVLVSILAKLCMKDRFFAALRKIEQGDKRYRGLPAWLPKKLVLSRCDES